MTVSVGLGPGDFGGGTTLRCACSGVHHLVGDVLRVVTDGGRRIRDCGSKACPVLSERVGDRWAVV
jgi:hypothetical protein